jgi:hypothetical protein
MRCVKLRPTSARSLSFCPCRPVSPIHNQSSYPKSRYPVRISSPKKLSISTALRDPFLYIKVWLKIELQYVRINFEIQPLQLIPTGKYSIWQADSKPISGFSIAALVASWWHWAMWTETQTSCWWGPPAYVWRHKYHNVCITWNNSSIAG